MKAFNSIGLAIALTLSLSACNSTPKDPVDEAEKLSLNQTTDISAIEATPEGAQKVNSTRYLARNLMGVEEREKLRNKIAQEAPSWGIRNTTIGFIGSAALTGNPMSVEGGMTTVAITAALDVASYIWDGSLDIVGQMWLPKEVNGVTIESPEQAKVIASQLTVEAIRKAYQKLGYDFEFTGTLKNGYQKLYSGTLREDANTTDVPYKPKYIVAIFTQTEYEAMDSVDPVEELSLGFTPAYRSSPAGHQITILGEHKTDANGNVVMTKSEDGYDVVAVQKLLWKTAVGRELYREISKEIPWITGNDTNFNRYVVHNGEVYSFFSTRASGFLNERVDG